MKKSIMGAVMLSTIALQSIAPVVLAEEVIDKSVESIPESRTESKTGMADFIKDKKDISLSGENAKAKDPGKQSEQADKEFNVRTVEPEGYLFLDLRNDLTSSDRIMYSNIILNKGFLGKTDSQKDVYAVGTIVTSANVIDEMPITSESGEVIKEGQRLIENKVVKKEILNTRDSKEVENHEVSIPLPSSDLAVMDYRGLEQGTGWELKQKVNVSYDLGDGFKEDNTGKIRNGLVLINAESPTSTTFIVPKDEKGSNTNYTQKGGDEIQNALVTEDLSDKYSTAKPTLVFANLNKEMERKNSRFKVKDARDEWKVKTTEELGEENVLVKTPRYDITKGESKDTNYGGKGLNIIRSKNQRTMQKELIVPYERLRGLNNKSKIKVVETLTLQATPEEL